MAENSKIEWTDHTFNPWIGCAKVSPGCDHCYAEAWAKRYGHGKLWEGERRRTTVANWHKPLAWNHQAAIAGIRAKVFCASLADWTDKHVPIEWLVDLLDVVRITPALDWLLLTKRPQLILRRIRLAMEVAEANGKSDLGDWLWEWLHGNPPRNVWLGTTAEDQTEAVRRIPHLQQAPALVRFLSCEPLVSPLDLRKLDLGGGITLDALTGQHSAEALIEGGWESVARVGPPAMPKLPAALPPVDWIIVGGESGPGARDMPAEWARQIRDNRPAFGAAFFMKQMSRKQPIPADLLVRQFPFVPHDQTVKALTHG